MSPKLYVNVVKCGLCENRINYLITLEGYIMSEELNFSSNRVLPIIHKSKFKKLDRVTQRNLLISWRSGSFSNEEIASAMGMGRSTFDKMCMSFDLPKRNKSGNNLSTNTLSQEELESASRVVLENTPSSIISSVKSNRSDSDSVKEEVAVTMEEVSPALPALVIIPDVAIYRKGNFPDDIKQYDIRKEGYVPDLVIVCKTPAFLSVSEKIPSELGYTMSDMFFINMAGLVVGYVKQA